MPEHFLFTLQLILARVFLHLGWLAGDNDHHYFTLCRYLDRVRTEKRNGSSIQSGEKYCIQGLCSGLLYARKVRKEWDCRGLNYSHGLMWNAACGEKVSKVLLCFRLYLISAYSTPVSSAMERNLQDRAAPATELKMFYLWGVCSHWKAVTA